MNQVDLGRLEVDIKLTTRPSEYGREPERGSSDKRTESSEEREDFGDFGLCIKEVTSALELELELETVSELKSASGTTSTEYMNSMLLKREKDAMLVNKEGKLIR